MLCKKGVFGNFAKFIAKNLYQSLFFNKVAGTLLKKRLWHKCFPVNFVKFLRTPSFMKHLPWWLLLHVPIAIEIEVVEEAITRIKDSELKANINKKALI